MFATDSLLERVAMCLCFSVLFSVILVGFSVLRVVDVVVGVAHDVWLLCTRWEIDPDELVVLG